jgi:hypothetical protein
VQRFSCLFLGFLKSNLSVVRSGANQLVSLPFCELWSLQSAILAMYGTQLNFARFAYKTLLVSILIYLETAFSLAYNLFSAFPSLFMLVQLSLAVLVLASCYLNDL